ncbi:hypothetical protein K7X08_011783 [Anisodus acutangulus]|uniref:Uncharacterized protein n=1 Tax=Anisodus acutangulus TaxID=402998 RepID=A0A9Q1MQP7_9SOLA|nr:hypothetical protein K7X08_011783 [Anisodus acutangulus]
MIVNFACMCWILKSDSFLLRILSSFLDWEQYCHLPPVPLHQELEKHLLCTPAHHDLAIYSVCNIWVLFYLQWPDPPPKVYQLLKPRKTLHLLQKN